MSKVLRKAEVLDYLDTVLLGGDVGKKSNRRVAENGDMEYHLGVKAPKKERKLISRRVESSDEEADDSSSKIEPVPNKPGWVSMIKNRVKENQKLVIDAEPAICERKSADFKNITLEKMQQNALPGRANKHHDSPCTTLGFGKDLVYSAGVDRRVVLYKVKSNHFESVSATFIDGSSRIRSSCLSSDQSKLYFGGEWGKIFSMDIETSAVTPLLVREAASDGSQIRSINCVDGNMCCLMASGRILHIDERTRRVARVYNSGSEARAISFSPGTPGKVYSIDKHGEMFIWDLGMGRCCERVVIDGAIAATGMASVCNGKFLIGNESGHFSLHSLDHLSQPIKTFNNIKSKIVSVHSERNLAFVMSEDQRASRFIHIGGDSAFVYQGWPSNSENSPCRTTAVALSGFDDLVAFGGTDGVVRLYKSRFA